jgi:exodeoxyribonuclease VII small subunit
MATPKHKSDDALSFDEAMSQAEQLLSQMESGEMELEDSLKAYERGMALLSRCQQVITTAQQRVEQISAASKVQSSGNDDTDGEKSE